MKYVDSGIGIKWNIWLLKMFVALCVLYKCVDSGMGIQWNVWLLKMLNALCVPGTRTVTPEQDTTLGKTITRYLALGRNEVSHTGYKRFD